MNAILKKGTEIDRIAWLEFLAHSHEAAIYVHPDFLDVVAPDWLAVEVWRDRTLLALMPIHIKQKAGYSYALQPSFCQFWGIHFAGENLGNAYKTYSHRRKIVKAIVGAIPLDIKWFLYGFAPEFDYPHPFHWEGYILSVRYTYRLDLVAGYAETEKNFGNDTKYDKRKAISQGVSIRLHEDAASSSAASGRLLQLIARNAADGKQLLTAAEVETLGRLVPMLLQSGLGKLYEAADADGNIVGSGLFGSFAGKTSYLMSAQLPAASNTGAMTLLIDQAIKDACSMDRVFDFEGSMIEGIEGFFRGFGGRPLAYLMIEKNALPLPIRWIRKLR